jgi:hypothetical protein
MADNIVGGLFGVNPAQLQQQRMAQDLKEGFMLAQLSPMERATAGIYAGSKQFGRAAQSLLGMEDPQLQEAAMAKKLSENFDVNSVEGLRGLAAELQRAGSLRYSQLAAQQANQLEQAGLTRQKTSADIQREERVAAKAELSTAQEERLRAELANLPPNATEAQVIEVVRKYGSPDKILQILTQSKDRQARLAEARLKGEGTKGEKEEKPLPAGTVKEIATAERINNTLNRTNTTLDKYITEVDENKIEFNLGKNIAGWVQRGTGKQDANTLKQVSLKKFLENERNNILLAAKGTQTEGDANRAMSQIFDRTDWTSNVAVSQALSDLKDYKNSQIDSNNVFMSSLRGGGLPVAPTAAPRTPPTAPQGQEFAADYAKYKAKYGANALPYEAYVAKRKGL